MLTPTRNSEKLAKALLKLLEDDDMRRKMGSMGHKRFRKLFVINEMVNKYQHLYENKIIQ